MDWKIVRQCEYKGYTITDTGAGFWIHRPNGQIMGETWSQTMLWSGQIGKLMVDNPAAIWYNVRAREEIPLPFRAFQCIRNLEKITRCGEDFENFATIFPVRVLSDFSKFARNIQYMYIQIYRCMYI